VTSMVADSMTMFRRDLRHLQRFPVMTISQVATPTIFLLLFVFVFGGALGGTGTGGRYVDYVLPGILAMSVGAGGPATAINVNADMWGGVIARFRTMPIARASVLAGQLISSVLRTVLAVGVTLVIAVVCGARPQAGLGGWLGVLGLVALLSFAFTWLGTAIGLTAKSEGGANGAAVLLTFLPFLSSAFVPTQTMPAGVAWVAQHQPYTPFIDALRALLAGTPVGSSAWLAVGWCGLIAAIGYVWALAAYSRDPKR